jgi:hypothetical protein
MIRFLSMVILFLLILAGVRSAGAALIEAHLVAPGDARITRDTATSLEWLDVNETVGFSVAEILAGGGNDPSGPGGWITNGWRYATLQDVCGLFEPRTGPLLGCSSSSPTVPSPGGIEELQNFLGVTDTRPEPPGGSIETTDGFYGEGAGLASLLTSTSGSGFAGVIPGGGTAGPGVGHYLIRDLPETSVFRLFSGFLGLLLLTRARA